MSIYLVGGKVMRLGGGVGASSGGGGGPSLPSWASPTQYAWSEIPNSALSSVVPSPVPSGTTGPNSKVDAWTSFAISPFDSSIWAVAAGGHFDYGGNEVDRLAIETESPAWSQILAPTPNASLTLAATHYLDGRPASRHHYFGCEYDEAANRVIIEGGSRYNDGFTLETMDAYDVGSNAYVAAGTYPNVSTLVTASGGLVNYMVCRDPRTGDIFVLGNFRLWKWTRSTNTWAESINTGNGVFPYPIYGQRMASAFDTSRNRILVAGGDDASYKGTHVYEPDTNTVTPITFTGASASVVQNAQEAGLIYAPGLDAYLLNNGGANPTIYQINASTFAITTPTLTGGATVPALAGGRGAFKKWLYAPRLGGVIYVPAYGSNAWFLKV